MQKTILQAGDQLGPYRITAPIGAGGMGEVYLARDPRLNRDVAIKISAQRFTERFEREAHAIAALNHPNICTLYDVGPNYLVMEYIEGESPQGPYALDEALRLAHQIADALEAAHEKGIIHRDLKPGNIKIKPDGTVKVLDFGLAKMGGTPTAPTEDSPTISMAATQAGVILGTAAYMSPEQARGKPVDKRADIWAFGVVLYEMLTGQRLFAGEDITDTLAAVLKNEPDWEKIPPPARRLLRSCLQKDLKQRLHDIGDAWRLLDDAPAPAAPSISRLQSLGWRPAGVLTVALMIAFTGWYRAAHPADPPLKPLVRLDVDLGSDVSLGSPNGASAIISPDSTRLVYVSQNRLFTRRLDQPKATELAGTDGALAPFFSPDGQWVAFFAGSKLKKVSVEGGAAIALCDTSASARGGSWGEDGNIVAALTSVGSVLSRIPSSGGAPTPVTELAPGEATHRWPQILPGGKAVLFTAHRSTTGFDAANIDVISLADHRRKTLVRGGTFGQYLATPEGAGYLVYVNRSTLFAVPFDLDALAVRGTPAPVVDDVAYSPAYGFAQISFSRTETLVYRSGGAGGRVTVQWLDSSGKTQPLLAKPGYYQRPNLSADGQHLILEASDGSGSDIWAYDFERDSMTRLTFGSVGADVPVPSPDGRYVALRAPGGIFWTRSDGAAKPQPLIQSKNSPGPFSFTRDSRRLVYQEITPGSGYDIWTVPIDSESAGLRAGRPEPFLQTAADERQASFSPDGRWIAYISDDSGTYQVYVRAFPDKGSKWQVSNSGGTFPKWSPNGHELFFSAPDNRIMVAAYAAKGDSFVAEKPRVWSEKSTADLGFGIATYDLAPDGKRVAALMPASTPEVQQTQNHVTFLENFFDELRRRVPAGK